MEKRNMKMIGMVLFYLVFFTKLISGNSDKCIPNINDNKTLICQCDPGEMLNFSSNNILITSVKIRDCDSVEVPVFAGLLVDRNVDSWTIENIEKLLRFELYMQVYELKYFKLSNIGEIPFLNKDSFDRSTKVDNFQIENTRIGSFEDIFGEHPVKMFTLKNVTIENLLGFNLMNGQMLKITDCKIKVVGGPLVLEHFEHIQISRTIFEFSNPGNVSLVGTKINLEKNTFLNATVQVVAHEKIDVRGTCGNGRSSMRLDSPIITSHGNKLPSQIVYVKKPNQQPEESGNEQCPGGYCKCPRMSDTVLNRNPAGTIRCSLFLLSALISYSLLTAI